MVMSQDLQAFLVRLMSMFMSPHNIRKTLNKNGVHGWIARRKLLLSKNNIAACLKYVKDHLDDPEGDWKNVLWTDESKMELFWLK